jgi:L-iditol 2-dehydrogenase
MNDTAHTNENNYLIIDKDKTIKFIKAPVPIPGPGEVKLKILYCGICATDIDIIEGKRKKTFPYSPGHEFSGIVEETGKDVMNIQPGTLVVGNPNYVCYDCYFCRCNEYNLCESKDVQHYSNGGFSNYMKIYSDYVIPVPETVSPKAATLAEVAACALHAVNFMNNIKQRVVCIIGLGTIGLLISELVKYFQLADFIVASDSIDFKREIALRLGCDETTGSAVSVLKEKISAFSPYGADVVFECSGSRGGLENSIKMVRQGGKIILVGRLNEDEDFTIHPCSLPRKEIKVIGSARYFPSEFEKAVQLLGSGAVHSREYFQKIFTLDEIMNAFEYVKENKGIKTLIQCH